MKTRNPDGNIEPSGHFSESLGGSFKDLKREMLPVGFRVQN
jgi:hypothetical protein